MIKNLTPLILLLKYKIKYKKRKIKNAKVVFIFKKNSLDRISHLKGPERD